MDKGTILYLNGVTSTGKTTLSKAIQQIADVNFYHLSNDIFEQMFSRKFLQENYWGYLGEAIVTMYHTAKLLSDLNKNVIIDGMLLELPELRESYRNSHYETMKNIFNDSPIYIIEVFCPLQECKRRNIERGDRGVDQSEWQSNYMAKEVDYDFSVNTLINNSEECARLICKMIKESQTKLET